MWRLEAVLYEVVFILKIFLMFWNTEKDSPGQPEEEKACTMTSSICSAFFPHLLSFLQGKPYTLATWRKRFSLQSIKGEGDGSEEEEEDEVRQKRQVSMLFYITSRPV